MNTSTRPIQVDGVRLDTLAWNVTAISRSVAARVNADRPLPGVDGQIGSLNDPLEAGNLGLDMFVRGTDVDGNMPAAGALDTYQANLDSLVHLFGKRHALLDVQEQVDAAGTMRRAWAKVVDVIAPQVIDQVGSVAQFTVGLVIPSGCWQDVNTADWSKAGVVSGTAYVITPLDGATERITDAIVTVTGPADAGVKVSDPNTGAYVSLNHALASTDVWRVNVGTWASRYGAGLTLGSADTAGTDGQAVTTFGGTVRQASFLPLVPVRASAADPTRHVSIQVTGTGFAAGTAVAVRAARKYAL